MPRSAADATRFTATGPYAYSKTNASTIQLSQPPPSNETPAQKVIRLRAAAQRAKLGQETRWDRLVERGKVWADRAHRATALSLVGLTVVSAVFASFSLGKMMLFNRRKRAAWFAEQQANYDRSLAESRRAELDGSLTDFQKMFLNKERALEQAEAEQRAKQGIWKRTKSWVFGGLATEEKPGGVLGFVSEDVWKKGQEKEAHVRREAVTADSGGSAVVTAAEVGKRVNGNRVSRTHAPEKFRGGPLDRLGEQTVLSMSLSSKGLVDWLTSR